MKEKLTIKKACVHNLKEVDLSLPYNQLIVFTGVSGSGKSSMAFDTIYVEGQRRYIESLSHSARRSFSHLPKPEAHIEGISPTIAIEQKTQSRSPRSTVGTLTGIYDFFRVLFAKIATPFCPISQEPLKAQSREKILKKLQLWFEENKGSSQKWALLAPYAKKKGECTQDFLYLLQKGYTRVSINGTLTEITGEEVLDKKKTHEIELVIDRFLCQPSYQSRFTEAVLQALEVGKGVFRLLQLEGHQEMLFSEYGYAKKSNISYPPLTPQDFTFNHPKGMCSTCQGLGTYAEFDLNRIIDPEKSIAEDCCKVASSYHTVRYKNIYENLAKLYGFSVHTPWKNLSEKARQVFLYGTEKKWTLMYFSHPHKKKKWSEYVRWQGVLPEAHQRKKEAKSERYQKKREELMNTGICPTCKGSRLKEYPSAARLQDKTILEYIHMPLEELSSFLKRLTLEKEETLIAQELLPEIQKRLEFLLEVGLGYLTLARSSSSLSGGESQRVRLASQIGTGLVGAIYILDEPSIGLHPQDHHHLIRSLQRLKQLGNTVIVVEHEEDMMRSADEIVDFGPLSGKKGGRIVAQGTIKEIEACPSSVTGAYLAKKKQIPSSPPRKLKMPGLTLYGASHHNLKHIEVNIPLGGLICLTGVSGSGKSSLLIDTLYPALCNRLHGASLAVGKYSHLEGVESIDKVIAIDQSPIGRTSRSNAATYLKILDEIRQLFASLPQSQARGWKEGAFSFNVKEGSCSYCQGMGSIRIDMDFLEDAYTLCPQCEGKRFEPSVLEVLYKEKSIYDILQMEVDSAIQLFEEIPKIQKKLLLLQKMGLGYLSLGQASPTLSGGEAQRIKLAKELLRPDTGKTLYILDEPTTGLHFQDLSQLMLVLQALIQKGNTIVTIEHNLDFIKACDWIIELGPKAGEQGGELIAQGPPSLLAKKKSPTGKALREKALAYVPPHLKAFSSHLVIEKARQNNLKAIDLTLPKNQIVLFTGPSGSGKTSLAFDTIYAEGQRRYTESLSAYARSLLHICPKPLFEKIEGLSPAIALESHKGGVNPRSTVGTLTEVYDFLRILYAHLGTPYCPETQEKIETIHKETVLQKIRQLPERTKIHILAPLSLPKGPFSEGLDPYRQQGFLRIRLNQTYYELEEEVPFDPQRKNELFLVIDRLLVKEGIETRLLEAIDTAAQIGKQTLTVATEKEDLYFNLSFAVAKTGKSYPPITHRTFSFNAEEGMCPECQGLGVVYGISLQEKKLLSFSTADFFSLLCKEKENTTFIPWYEKYFQSKKIDPYLPIEKLSEEKRKIVLQGAPSPYIDKQRVSFTFVGLETLLENAAKSGVKSIREPLLFQMYEQTCPECKGCRLNPLARNVRVQDLTLPAFCSLPIGQAFSFLKTLSIEKHPFLRDTLQNIQKHLKLFIDLGIDYLSLDRSTPSLSGGELQRIRLARQLGTSLCGCLYILDEPTMGLHPADIEKLNQALLHLKDLGNTLIVVEHDPMTIALADWVVDFGPKAGIHGGTITAQGTLAEIQKNPHSLTGQYLSGKKRLTPPKIRRIPKHFFYVEKAHIHNLKNISLSLPVGCFTCITGVSGSGKSSLLESILHQGVEKALLHRVSEIDLSYAQLKGLHHFHKLVAFHQAPLGATPRSDVSTYTELLTLLRQFYAQLKAAKIKGLQPKHFSYHHRQGMCRTCWGMGYKWVDLQFLPPLKVECEACQGFRLNPLSLEVTYKNKHLGQVLQLTVEEALDFFSEIPSVTKKLSLLKRVGLDYLKLGQEITTLSTGEAQRIRLSRELSKRSTGKTLYLLDEPTLGLHFEDIAKLLPIFQELVDKKNTLIVVEHNLDFIRQVDYLIDLGPGSGEEGGEIIAQGPLKQVLKQKNSITAKYLKNY